MTIEPVIAKYKMGEQPSEYSYWQTQSYEARLAALEEIRQQYNRWTGNVRPRFQRVYQIVKQQ